MKANYEERSREHPLGEERDHGALGRLVEVAEGEVATQHEVEGPVRKLLAHVRAPQLDEIFHLVLQAEARAKDLERGAKLDRELVETSRLVDRASRAREYLVAGIDRDHPERKLGKL